MAVTAMNPVAAAVATQMAVDDTQTIIVLCLPLPLLVYHLHMHCRTAQTFAADTQSGSPKEADQSNLLSIETFRGSGIITNPMRILACDFASPSHVPKLNRCLQLSTGASSLLPREIKGFSDCNNTPESCLANCVYLPALDIFAPLLTLFITAIWRGSTHTEITPEHTLVTLFVCHLH